MGESLRRTRVCPSHGPAGQGRTTCQMLVWGNRWYGRGRNERVEVVVRATDTGTSSRVRGGTWGPAQVRPSENRLEHQA